MFETTFVGQSESRGTWTFSSSLILQCTVVSGLAIASLWLPVARPESPLLNLAIPAPQFRKVVQVVSTSIERQVSTSTQLRRFQYIPPAEQRSATRIGATMDAMVAELPLMTGGSVGFASGHGDGLAGLLELPAPPKPVVQPRPEPVSRLTVGGDVLSSKLIHRVQPVYPEIARRARIQGVVRLHGVITRDGRIAQLRVISGHPLLVKAALDAVGQWVYSPTLLNKQAVEVEAPIEVRFILGQ